MVLEAANCDPDDQRPCSTQKTSSGSGSAPGATMRSLAMMRSCLPPLTSSPARRSKGRLLRLTQDQLIYGRAAIVIGCGSSLRIARASQAGGTLFADGDFAAGQAFVQGKKCARILLR